MSRRQALPAGPAVPLSEEAIRADERAEVARRIRRSAMRWNGDQGDGKVYGRGLLAAALIAEAEDGTPVFPRDEVAS